MIIVVTRYEYDVILLRNGCNQGSFRNNSLTFPRFLAVIDVLPSTIDLRFLRAIRRGSLGMGVWKQAFVELRKFGLCLAALRLGVLGSDEVTSLIGVLLSRDDVLDLIRLVRVRNRNSLSKAGIPIKSETGLNVWIGNAHLAIGCMFPFAN